MSWEIGVHATTLENAMSILRDGFRCGKTGMFGGGIYLAATDESALKKAQCNATTIILCKVVPGRIKVHEIANHDWNVQKLNSMGYDTVLMNHCRTGPELCVYENWRVTPIIAIFGNRIFFKAK